MKYLSSSEDAVNEKMKLRNFSEKVKFEHTNVVLPTFFFFGVNKKALLIEFSEQNLGYLFHGYWIVA